MDAVEVNRARAQRIRERVSHERVVALFPGVITARNIDISSLVSAGSNTAVPVLHRLGRRDRMRIFVDVPPADVEYVHEGQICAIQAPE